MGIPGQGPAAERYLVAQWRKQIREAGKRLLQSCTKQPMPVDAVAFGATVPATHLYDIPTVRDFEPVSSPQLGASSTSGMHSGMVRDALPGQGSENTWGSRRGASFKAESALRSSSSRIINILGHMRDLATARTYKQPTNAMMMMLPQQPSNRHIAQDESLQETGGDRRVRPVMSMLGSTTMGAGSMTYGNTTMGGSSTLRAFVASSISVPMHQNSFSIQKLPKNEIVRRQLGLPRMSSGVEQALVHTMTAAEKARMSTAKRVRPLWVTTATRGNEAGRSRSTGSAPAGEGGQRPSAAAVPGGRRSSAAENGGSGAVVRTLSAMVHRTYDHNHPHAQIQAAAHGSFMFGLQGREHESGGSEEFDEVLQQDLSKDAEKVVRFSQYRYTRTTVTRMI